MIQLLKQKVLREKQNRKGTKDDAHVVSLLGRHRSPGPSASPPSGPFSSSADFFDWDGDDFSESSPTWQHFEAPPMASTSSWTHHQGHSLPQALSTIANVGGPLEPVVEEKSVASSWLSEGSASTRLHQNSRKPRSSRSFNAFGQFGAMDSGSELYLNPNEEENDFSKDIEDHNTISTSSDTSSEHQHKPTVEIRKVRNGGIGSGVVKRVESDRCRERAPCVEVVAHPMDVSEEQDTLGHGSKFRMWKKLKAIRGGANKCSDKEDFGSAFSKRVKQMVKPMSSIRRSRKEQSKSGKLFQRHSVRVQKGGSKSDHSTVQPDTDKCNFLMNEKEDSAAQTIDFWSAESREWFTERDDISQQFSWDNGMSDQERSAGKCTILSRFDDVTAPSTDNVSCLPGDEFGHRQRKDEALHTFENIIKDGTASMTKQSSIYSNAFNSDEHFRIANYVEKAERSRKDTQRRLVKSQGLTVRFDETGSKASSPQNRTQTYKEASRCLSDEGGRSGLEDCNKSFASLDDGSKLSVYSEPIPNARKTSKKGHRVSFDDCDRSFASCGHKSTVSMYSQPEPSFVDLEGNEFIVHDDEGDRASTGSVVEEDDDEFSAGSIIDDDESENSNVDNRSTGSMSDDDSDIMSTGLAFLEEASIASADLYSSILYDRNQPICRFPCLAGV